MVMPFDKGLAISPDLRRISTTELLYTFTMFGGKKSIKAKNRKLLEYK